MKHEVIFIIAYARLHLSHHASEILTSGTAGSYLGAQGKRPTLKTGISVTLFAPQQRVQRILKRRMRVARQRDATQKLSDRRAAGNPRLYRENIPTALGFNPAAFLL